MHIAADSGWHIGWPIHIAALQRWHIDQSIHIAALEQRHIGRPIHIAALNRWYISHWKKCLIHTLDNTIWISVCVVNNIELGGILVQSMHIAADSWWHIGYPIHIIAALQRCHIDRSIHIAALISKDILVDQYILLRLTDDILFGQYILLPTGQTYWSTNTYCCAYAMTYCSVY